MYMRKWLKAIRVFLAFLLAPAIVSICLFTSLDLVLARLGAHPDGPALIMLGTFALILGLVVPYLGALCLGFFYFIHACLGQRRSDFWAVAIATLLFALVYPTVVYLSLRDSLHASHSVAKAVAAPQVPAVILSGLCFYFISLWKRGERSS